MLQQDLLNFAGTLRCGAWQYLIIKGKLPECWQDPCHLDEEEQVDGDPTPLMTQRLVVEQLPVVFEPVLNKLLQQSWLHRTVQPRFLAPTISAFCPDRIQWLDGFATAERIGRTGR